LYFAAFIDMKFESSLHDPLIKWAHGTPDLTSKWIALGKWESSKEIDRPSMLTVTVSKNNPCTVEETGQTPLWSALNASSHVPREYKDLKLKLDIDIEKDSLTIS
jgi:hypothetical protein